MWAWLRIALGWTFLWAFIDKLIGFGFTTEHGSGWLVGGSPTYGFLKFGTHGPFAPLFQAMAGSGLVDWLFMLGLLLIGLSLLLGIFIRLSTFFGGVLLFMIYLATFLPEHNPLIDEHIIYIIALAGISYANAGTPLGLGRWWSQTALVKKVPWLR